MRIVVADPELQKEILALAHEGHPGFARTYNNLRLNYYWRRMSRATKTYVAYCPECLRNKPHRHKPYGHLRPILSPSIPFDTLTLDLITDLPESTLPILGPTTEKDQQKGELYDSIMTVTDKFSKAVKFIEGRKDWGSSAWSEKFYDRVVTSWGFPKTLITDQDKRFIARMWKELFNKAGTRCITTTAWHPAGDGQSERTNQTLEIMLRFYVDARQSDWVKYLPTMEAIVNNSTSATTTYSPNEILYGMRTRTALDLLAAPLSEHTSITAIEVAEEREVIRQEAKDAIAVAQKLMTLYHNKDHKEPDFSSGYAFISLKRGYTLPSIEKKKLAVQRIGPFKIIEPAGKGRAFKLLLPDHYKIHDTISIVHLEPAPAPGSDPFKRVRNEYPDPVQGTREDDDEAEWEIEKLINKRTVGAKGKKSRTEYLVRWKGWGDEYDMWYDVKDLHHAKELVQEYEETNRIRT